MKKIRIVALLMVVQIHVLAQRSHFIAMQSENKQPYSAKIETNVFNSTPTGHLIIPRLTDSTYIITIGFSKKIVAEEKFSITITKDVGFILRITKDKGLILSNSQTAQIIMPVKQQQDFAIKDSSTNNTKKDEGFAKLMSQVVNDSAVMENMYVADEPKKEEPKKEIVKNETPTKPVTKIDSTVTTDLTKKKNEDLLRKKSDSSAVVIKKKNDDSLHKKVAVIKTPEKKEKVLQPKIEKSVVKKLSEQKTDSAMELVYEDFVSEGIKDTIHIFIPLDSNLVINKKPAALATVNNENIKKDSTIIPETKPETKTDSPLFRQTTVNVNCKNTATDYDVDKLRVKMLAIEDEDDKISTAKKIFKTKCFSTNQISALSEVFITDAGKYKLFDAAYSYVSDVNNFTRLQSLLKDGYYITRFKAMIK